jgi:hypothetical protein
MHTKYRFRLKTILLIEQPIGFSLLILLLSINGRSDGADR